MRDWWVDWTSDEFQIVFWSAKRAMKEAADATYRQHGVREGQQFILMCLWYEDGLTPGEIARRLGLATPTVTKATTRMEASGLVERRPHPRDARLVCVHLTQRGHELRGTLAAAMRDLSERALRSFTPTERQEFIRFLSGLYHNLTTPTLEPESPAANRDLEQ